MIASRFAGLAALLGSGALALALLTQAISRASSDVAVFGFGLLAVSVFLVSFELRRARPIGAALGMVAVALGSSLALLAGREFAGSLAVIPLVGVGVAIPFIAAPIVAVGAARAELVGNLAALALTGAPALVLVSTPLGGMASISSFVLYVAAWSWIGLSLMAHARLRRQPDAPP